MIPRGPLQPLPFCGSVDSDSFLKICAKHGIKEQEAKVKHILIYLRSFEEIMVEKQHQERLLAVPERRQRLVALESLRLWKAHGMFSCVSG